MRAARGTWTTPSRTPVMMRPLMKRPPFRTGGSFLTSAMTLTERSASLTEGLMNFTFPVKARPGKASVVKCRDCPVCRAAISVDGTETVRLSTRLSTT